MKTLILLALVAAGCGGGQTVVVVTVQGSRVGVSSLGVLAKLNGTTGQAQFFETQTQELGLRLPAGAAGALEIDVLGLDAAGCAISFASATGSADGQPEIDLTLELSPVPRTCS